MKTTAHLLLPTIVTMILLSSCFAPDGDPQRGKRWYSMHNCSSCHGTKGNNGRAANISSLDMSFSAFVKFLRKPGSPSMPPFPKSKLSESDAADIYVWLKSLPEGK